MERTLTIFKPDSVAAGQAGAMLAQIEAAGFRVLGLKRLRLSPEQAESFYQVHRARPFFGGLVKFMTEGPVIVAALEAEQAVSRLRELMGATDPAKAAAGTLRKQFAGNIERNAIHGSDSAENANIEIAYFFAGNELI